MRRINPARTGLLLSVLLSGPALSATTADALPPNVTLGELEATQASNLILEQKVRPPVWNSSCAKASPGRVPTVIIWRHPCNRQPRS
jgi:hypothetical protein